MSPLAPKAEVEIGVNVAGNVDLNAWPLSTDPINIPKIYPVCG